MPRPQWKERGSYENQNSRLVPHRGTLPAQFHNLSQNISICTKPGHLLSSTSDWRELSEGYTGDLCTVSVTSWVYNYLKIKKLRKLYSGYMSWLTNSWNLFVSFKYFLILIKYCPWNFPGKDTGTDCHFLLQRILLAQGYNQHLLCLLLGRWILYHSRHLESPTKICNSVHKHK